MISIIIPALNEETHISRCIESLRAEGFSGEIIVADGGYERIVLYDPPEQLHDFEQWLPRNQLLLQQGMTLGSQS